jgi:nonsense-mediated mRNA decay protein 3
MSEVANEKKFVRKKFCPKCGKQTDDLYDSVCGDCMLAKLSRVAELPEVMKIRKCKVCGKYFADDIRKSSSSIENALDSKLSELLQQPDVKHATYRVAGNKLHVTLTLEQDGLEKTESKAMNLFVKKIMCEICSIESAGYYQSIIQLRMPKEALEKILDFIYAEIARLQKKDKHAFISLVNKTRGGVDMYIGSKNIADRIANEIKIKYRASIRVTSTLSGAKGGKKTYKDTILISLERA